MTAIDKTLDVTGLTCPLPVLKAKKAMKDIAPGGTLEILATDPGAVEDFDVFCSTTGNTLVESGESGGVYRFVIKNTS